MMKKIQPFKWLHIFITLQIMGVTIVFPWSSLAAEKSPQVLVLPLKGEINKAQLFFLRRGLQLAQGTDEIKAVVIDMDTPGGMLQVTEEIIAWMRIVSAAHKPIFSYVNAHAQSAGAIVCLASDAIFMAPGSRIGSAAPIMVTPTGGVQEMSDDIKEKILSDIRSLVRGLAQEKGYLPDLAMKMVDKNVEFAIGDRVICPQGQLLNLTAEEAIEIIPPLQHPLLATAIVKTIPELLANRQLGQYQIKTFTPHSAEKLAYWITLLSPLLMAAAAIGIYIEFKTPGFGLPGIIGSISLVLFLFGHYIAGLAGKEDIFLVVTGILLLLVEAFILPGFGIWGILGIAALLGGMIMAMIPLFPKVPNLPSDIISPYGNMEIYLNNALINLLLTITISGVVIYLLAKFLPKTKFYGSLVLLNSETAVAGYIATNIEENMKLIGKIGVALTTLRPAGLIDIDGNRIDVISNGDYIDEGEKVEVLKVDGPSIIVGKWLDPAGAAGVKPSP